MTLTKQEHCSVNYLPVIRKNKVRMTSRVNPPTAAVAITRICPCSAAMSEAERKHKEVKSRVLIEWVVTFHWSNVARTL